MSIDLNAYEHTMIKRADLMAQAELQRQLRLRAPSAPAPSPACAPPSASC